VFWYEFQDCARRLSTASTEADWRSAISRAYYAVFHHFREFFRGRGLDLGNGAQAHSNLYFGLANCGILGTREIADGIDDLRKDRTTADYDIWKTMDGMDAQSAVHDADAILGDFQNLIRSTSAQQIIDELKRYLISIGRITP